MHIHQQSGCSMFSNISLQPALPWYPKLLPAAFFQQIDFSTKPHGYFARLILLDVFHRIKFIYIPWRLTGRRGLAEKLFVP